MIAPKTVVATADQKAEFSIRLVPKNIDFDTVVEIFPSCECLTTGERSKVSRRGEEIVFNMIGRTHSDSPRTWHVMIQARVHSGDKGRAEREISVSPSTISVSCSDEPHLP